MYDELGKRLRSLAGMLPQKHTLPSGADTVICSLEAFLQIKELAGDAADAIENLVATVGTAYNELANNEANKLRWIHMSEGLPEDRSDVLAYLKYEVGGRIAAANYDKGMWQDCVMGGLYRTEEGVVTHWMPIPQPPKEET